MNIQIITDQEEPKKKNQIRDEQNKITDNINKKSNENDTRTETKIMSKQINEVMAFSNLINNNLK
jgi:hypothetical protein